VVGEGDLAGPDDLLEKDQVRSHTAGQSFHGDLIGSSEEERGDPFPVQGVGLGEE
jgi:hypothetical protein